MDAAHGEATAEVAMSDPHVTIPRMTERQPCPLCPPRYEATLCPCGICSDDLHGRSASECSCECPDCGAPGPTECVCAPWEEEQRQIEARTARILRGP